MLDERLEMRGNWWLPDAPAKKIGGILKYDPVEGPRLELTDAFHSRVAPNRYFPLDPARRIPAIQGVAEGKEVTLVDTYLSTTLHFPVQEVSSARHGIVLVGAHLPNRESIRPRSLAITYDHLDPWVDISGIDVQQTGPLKWSITVHKPEGHTWPLADGSSLSIEFSQEGPGLSAGLAHTSVTQHAHVLFEFPDPCPFDEALRRISRFRLLLSLGVGRATRTTSVQLWLPPSDDQTVAGAALGEPVEVLVARDEPGGSATRVIPAQMVFTFADIKDRFAELCNKWFSEDESLRVVHDLYLSARGNRSAYLASRFLNLVQALESYHRLTTGGARLAPDEFDDRLNRVVEGAPLDLKRWVKESLSHCNEKTLSARLRELIRSNPQVITPVPGDNVGSFRRKVVQTRNYLTHFDPLVKESAAIGEELYHLCLPLRRLMEYHLLIDLGFDPEFAESAARKGADEFRW